MADLKEFQRKMEKTLDVLASDFAAVRAGRANASVLDRISVDYYGSPTPIQQIAAIASPDPRQLVITPWDGTALKLVKQIHKYSETGKVAIRNIRRDAMEAFKKKQKASEITEDDLKVAEKDLQKLTDDMCKEVDALLEKKEKELMAV